MDAFNAVPRPEGSDDTELGQVRAASVAADRSRLATMAGITFLGERDLYAALGYKRVLDCEDYRNEYDRGDIAARIVEAYPKATWREGAEIIEDEDPEIDTQFETAFKELNDRLNLWNVFQRADILAGLGSYAGILIGAPGETTEELKTLRGSDGIMFLAPYGKSDLTVDQCVTDPTDKRFSLPLTYRFKRQTSGGSVARTVHWSRVIHIADNILDDPINGTPLLKRVFNRLMDKEKVVGGGSEAFWLRVHAGMVFNLDPALKAEAAEITKMKEEAEEFAHNMRRTIAARGFKVDVLSSDVSNFNNQLDALMSIVSAATGIPKRILMGSERGELASSQDSETWDEKVRDRRTEFATPIVRQLIDRFIQYGALPKPKEYLVRWPDVAELTETEKATIAGIWSGLNTKAKGTVVLPEEIRDRVLGLPKLTPQQIADNEPEPVPDELDPANDTPDEDVEDPEDEDPSEEEA